MSLFGTTKRKRYKRKARTDLSKVERKKLNRTMHRRRKKTGTVGSSFKGWW